MAGPVKTEGVVLRSLRYGEADRILHLYTPERGRVGAIAKGVRRARSRFGGRLEPFFRLHLVLHEGRSDLLTVTAAETVAGYRACARTAAALDAAARACDAVGAPVRRPPSPIPASTTCSATSWRCSTPSRRAPDTPTSSPSGSSCCSPPGLAPQLAACASCGEREHLVGFSGAAGGVVCTPARRAPSRWRGRARLPGRRARPPAGRRRRRAEARALRQAERAIDETLEHHAGIRWRHAVAR